MQESTIIVMKQEIVKKGFIKSIPIMCSYLFVSMAYGMMMEEAGFHWYYSLLASLTIYTGAFQFALITFLSSGASILTIAVTAVLLNSRQVFYSLTFVQEFVSNSNESMHWDWKKLLYMIHTMTDETYAVNCTLEKDEKGRKDIMFFVALFSRCYWMTGAVAGGMIGQLLPFRLEGIDFCMTALFVIIFIDQWEKSKNHLPAILGVVVSLLCLMLLGQEHFMLASLIVVSGILIFVGENSKTEVRE